MGVGCVSRKGGCWALQEAGGADKAVSHCWGLVWGNHTPRGWWYVLGSGRSGSAAAAGLEREAATARPGREGSTGREGGWVSGRRL